MAVKFSNNAYSTLSANITNSATSFDVASVATFPTLGGSDHMYLSIIGSSYVEIIKVTGVSGTTLTCVRGQDGTTGTAADSGDRVELRVTTAMLTDAIADSNVDVFKTIVIAGQTDVIADSGADTLTLVASGGTTLTTTADQITIDTPAAQENSFKNITDGSNVIIADSTTDTLSILGSGGTTVTNTPGTDTVTISSTEGVSAGFSIAMSIAL